VSATRALDFGPSGGRSAAYRCFRAIQPGRRTRGSPRGAIRGATGPLRRRDPWKREDGLPGHVPAVRSAWRRIRFDLPEAAAHARRGYEAPAAPLRQSKRTVYKLAALFSLDAFGGGFIV